MSLSDNSDSLVIDDDLPVKSKGELTNDDRID